ncbi:chorismate--pyruvate lyase family protein [Magnetofaba australis]|uniref:Putative chorismate lyase n=1 Tax=Magnetofaba australis IT-1 TaxID=1434232 RepID=A0A1Y2K132_9PROT|nr:chorismate pyruvate-lyase family protein [Magnetofaba australis]OSM01377.1 putative chorismate lyase [Magnetofaba australis IT-1]
MPAPALQFDQHWDDPQTLLAQRGEGLNADWRALLGCEGSLTAALQAHYGAPVLVSLVGQVVMDDAAAEPAGVWDDALQLPFGARHLARDAWLNSPGHLRVFAHSQILLDGLDADTQAQIEQGVKPLGGLFLAQQASVRRTGLALALASAPQLGLDQPVWCRRSIFVVNEIPRARILELFAPLE